MDKETRSLIDAIMKMLWNQMGLRSTCDYKVKGHDRKSHIPHVVIRAIVYQTVPQNFISFILNAQEIRVYIPYVGSNEEFKSKYGFFPIGFENYDDKKKKTWARISQKHFLPLLEKEGDASLIINFFKAVLNPQADQVKMSMEEVSELGENITLDDPLPASVEGKLIIQYRTHRRRERDPEIIRLKKMAALEADPSLRCEACSLSMQEMYGEPGKHFCEVHHRTPLWCLDESETVETSLDDLAVLCPNCHSIIHRDRKNPMTVDSLKEQIKSLR